MTGAEIAGVVLGGFGSLTGIVALWQNRRAGQESRRIADRSHNIEQRMAEIEEARHGDELRPNLTMRHTRTIDSTHVVLTITNDDKTDLDKIELVAAVEVPALLADGIGEIIAPWRGLRMGESLNIQVRTTDQPGGRLVVTARATAGDRSWTLPLDCEVTATPQPNIF